MTQHRLTLDDGTDVQLSASDYHTILKVIQDLQHDEPDIAPASSINALEAEFADLFDNPPTIAALLAAFPPETAFETAPAPGD